MQKHTEIYLKYFRLGEMDIVIDEYEYIINNREMRAVDIHHIHGRGKSKDCIENLMALSRENHTKAHLGELEDLDFIHRKFITNNPY